MRVAITADAGFPVSNLGSLPASATPLPAPYVEAASDGYRLRRPYWVRLERRGSLFTGWISPDGEDWTEVGRTELDLERDLYAGLAVSAIQQPIAGNKLLFDPNGKSPVSFGNAFMSYPENARYDFIERTFRFGPGQSLSAASLVRIQFSDRSERRWQVLVDPATAQAGFPLPTPPSGFSDRTFHAGATTGSRSLGPAR